MAMDRKQEFETIVKIAERAEDMGISAGQRITLIMDLENAHKDVGLNLQELLEADELNFAHDVMGIQAHMNRGTGKLEDFFLPRYAKQDVASLVEDAFLRAQEQNNNPSKVDIDKGL